VTNAISPDGAGASLSLQGGGTASPFPGNGTFIEIQLNLADYSDPIVTFTTRGTSSGFSTGTWSYSVAGGGFTTIAGVNTATTSTTYALATVNLTAINAVDGQSDVRLRYTLSGATSAVGNNRIDNLQVNATQTNDTTPPTLSSVSPLSPADNATNVPITATPTFILSEAVRKGTGNIVIRRGIDNSVLETIAVTSTQVTVAGANVTITPTANFDATTAFYIEVAAGAIEDLVGNDFAGISGATAWNFTTATPSALPTVTETFTTQQAVRPTGAVSTTDYYGEGNGQGNFALYGFGNFNISKLDFGLSGASVITDVATAEFTLTHNDRTFTQGTELEFFLTTDSSVGKSFNPTFVNGIDNAQYSFAPISLGKFAYTPEPGGSTDTFVLDFSAAGAAGAAVISRLNTGEDFAILLAATTPMAAITYSGKGNTFDPGDPLLKLTVEETTGVDTTAPTVAFFTPANGAGGLPISSNLRISFNELIRKGTSGTISIYRAGTNALIEAIDVTSPQVTVNLGTVTIDPTAALESGANFYVQITPGTIEDVSANPFAGFGDTTTWTFSTAQPPITVTGPFSISQNAPAGTIVGTLNPSIGGKEGIRYAMLGGSGGSSPVKAAPDTDYLVTPVFTIGDTFEGAAGAYNPNSAGNYSPPGTPDGIGAFALNANTVRVFVNHEIEVPNSGSGAYPYTLTNGTTISKGGARVSYFDIDKASRRVIDAGLAFGKMYDRTGTVVTSASQLELGGLDRTCSSALFEPNLWGAGRGLVDRIYLFGEETSTSFGHPHGGTFWALDTATGDLWALPDLGRGSWENAALVDTGNTTHVAFLLGDDLQDCPLYLYVGLKSTAGGASFPERNGLRNGQLYVWKATNGNTTPQQFNGTGSTRPGTWSAVDARNAGAAGTTGHDAQGYKNDTRLRNDSFALGAFRFSRPEDLSTSPTDGSIVAFTSTGRGSVYPLDNWGDTYILDINFNPSGVPTAGDLRLLYDGDDAGGGQFMSPEEGLRCPDNLDWADDGYIYVQEDQANQIGDFGAAGFESSIWRLDSVTGEALRVAEVDRSTVLPLGSTDTNTGDVGNWESSGIVDVSTLFGETPGSLFLMDLQAHSVTTGLIASKALDQGGQICFLERGLDRGAFQVNPNTGVITLANPEALDPVGQPSHELRIQAYDGTNHTFRSVSVNVTNGAVAKSNDFKVATYNTSLYRDNAGRLITDLAPVTNTQAQNIARVIQRNNADVILVNEFDYDADGLAARRFRENYLEVGQNGESPVYYPYAYIAPSNTGVPSGFDLDNNGSVVTTPGATGFGEDAFGFGVHAGQYSFVVYSKFPIDTENVRTFQRFLWKDMPGALLPDDPDIAGTGDWYSPAELNVYRLSSKNHADVPVLVNGTRVHILASHPTPPVFDSPGSGLPWKAGVDHNGRRNSDEIRFWADYVNPAASGYIYDDGEFAAANFATPASPSGGLPANTRFVLCGDQNADQNEGDSTPPAILSVINSPLYNGAFVPGGGAGPDPDDTAGFSGGVRVDYAVPSNFGLNVRNGSVFWPGAGDPMSGAVSASDHYLVYVNLTLTGVSLPPSVDLQTYYAPAQGLTGVALANALHQIIDDQTVIDYGVIGEIMKVIDEAGNDEAAVRLLYSNANLPKSSFNIGGGWNREHTWPRSDGVGEDGPDYSDLHHLFPCKETVNSLRGNLPFDESTNQESDPFAPESFKDSNSWEPLDRDKGVVARALLYMMVRYDGGESLTTDLVLDDSTGSVGTHGVLSTLLAWHRAHPPTDYERARNNAIYAGVTVGATTYRQGNRNPFIDFPYFAEALYPGTGDYSFNRWQFERFSFTQLADPSIVGEDADADGDGTDNYGEYLQNGDPNSGDDRALEFIRNGNQLTLIFHRPKGAPEAPDLESSITLLGGSWTEVTGWEAAAVVADLGNYERLTYTTTINPIVDKRRFWRVIYK
jgi:endonuclease I